MSFMHREIWMVCFTCPELLTLVIASIWFLRETLFSRRTRTSCSIFCALNSRSFALFSSFALSDFSFAYGTVAGSIAICRFTAISALCSISRLFIELPIDSNMNSRENTPRHCMHLGSFSLPSTYRRTQLQQLKKPHETHDSFGDLFEYVSTHTSHVSDIVVV
jgi:hypothetical protein